nr:hypothetical protein [uncultured Draconibacterium sp.]
MEKYHKLTYWIIHPKLQLDRAISGSILKQVLSLVLIFFFLFGIWFGVSFYFKDGDINKDMTGRPWEILSQMIDPGNMHMAVENDVTSEEIISKPVQPTTANWKFRLFVFLIELSGVIVFGGLLISTITNIILQRVEKINDGFTNYRFKNHDVIIGFDFMAIGLIKKLLKKSNDNKIILHSIQKSSEVREKLFSRLSKKDRKRIILMHGSRDLPDELKRLKLKNAQEIYILGEAGEYDHDAKNVECYNLIDASLGNKNQNKINCHVLFENSTTYTAFQFLDINKTENSKTNFISFNFYEEWAQRVFQNGKFELDGATKKYIEYNSLDYKPITKDSEKYIHLVIVGMTQMGIAIGIEAARLCHFANHEKKKTRITFIDADAENKDYLIANCYPTFYDAVSVNHINASTGTEKYKECTLPFINIELEFVTGNIESKQVRKLLSEWAIDPMQIITLAICFNHPPFSLSQGMYLPQEIFDNEIPILIRQESSYALVNLLKENNKITNRYKNILPFGMIEDCIELKDDIIPKHINHYYWHCDEKLLVFNRDKSEKEWASINERDKISNRFNANSFNTKLKAVGCTKSSDLNSEQIELLARMEHARWNIERLIAGFSQASESDIIKSKETADQAWYIYEANNRNFANSDYNELKEIHNVYVKPLKEKMKHPCIVPYDELSEYYKNIDKQLVKYIPQITNQANE